MESHGTGEGVLFVEPEMGRVVTQRLGSGRVLAVDSRGLADAKGGGFDDAAEDVDTYIPLYTYTHDLYQFIYKEI